MKLSALQLNQIEDQVGVKAIPDQHPAMKDLKTAFGDHTFFLDAGGLNIIEPNQDPEDSRGVVIRLATWTNDERNELAGHDPRALDALVNLAPPADSEG